VPFATKRQKVAGTLRRAVRSKACARILGGRHMECAYYFEIQGGGTVERESQRIMEASQQSIATSMGSSPRFLQAIEDHLPTALLLLEITPDDGVRLPLAVDLKSRSSTYPQRWNLKNARHAICYSSTANPSCLMSIRSISRPADRFISTKPSLETEQMGSPFQSNHWR
jgi:hypothetical protein